MPKVSTDHFVPRAYLRGFTCKNTAGDDTGRIVVYVPGLGLSKTLGINKDIACEPEFYNKHPLDKQWSATIERTWPDIRTRLAEREASPNLLDGLFQFVSAQWIRTPRYMNCLARPLALQKATVSEIQFQGGKFEGMFVDIVKTNEVTSFLPAHWKAARAIMEKEYAWQIFHALPPQFFLTNDNPVQCDPTTGRVTAPLSLNMALVGTWLDADGTMEFSHADATPDVIENVNHAIVAGCDSFVYAHEQTDKLRRFVQKNHVRRDILAMGRSFSNNP